MSLQLRTGAVILIWLFVVSGCRLEQSADDTVQANPARQVQFQGHLVNVYDTAQAQLAWAISLHDNPEQSRIAFRFILDRFADDQSACGQARLELAYLELGRDFRLARPADCERAAELYAMTAEQYKELPWIRAKALWYRGWILADLLHSPMQALPLFEQVADNYGDVPIKQRLDDSWEGPLSPVTRKQKAFEILGQVTWAETALLKIIEYSPDSKQRVAALQSILRKNSQDRVAGLALLQLLEYPSPPPVVMRAARRYVRESTENFLKHDILARLEPVNGRTDHGAGS